MISKLILTILLLASFLNPVKDSKKYYKEYYSNGGIKTEGWIENTKKNGYWKNYYPNGKIESQGHYINGNRENYWYFYDANKKQLSEGNYADGFKINWWLFYDKIGNINHKCQLKNNIKDGYCLKYKNKKITAAVKYRNGVRIKEWTTFANFKKENKLSDLQ